MKKIFTLLFLGLLAYGVDPAVAADATAGKKVFKKCKACHDTGTKKKVGPPLGGIVGRPSAQVEGFKYSKAMKNANITWDEESLDKFLAKPRKYIKGTKMVFAGLKKEKDRQNLIAYLKTLN